MINFFVFLSVWFQYFSFLCKKNESKNVMNLAWSRKKCVLDDVFCVKKKSQKASWILMRFVHLTWFRIFDENGCLFVCNFDSFSFVTTMAYSRMIDRYNAYVDKIQFKVSCSSDSIFGAQNRFGNWVHFCCCFVVFIFDHKWW